MTWNDLTAAWLADVHANLGFYMLGVFVAGLAGGSKLREWLYSNDRKLRQSEWRVVRSAEMALGIQRHEPHCPTQFRGPFPGPCTCDDPKEATT